MEMSSEDVDVNYDSDIGVDSDRNDSIFSNTEVAGNVDDEPSSLQWL
jgi:hypothetical protein